MKWKFVVGLAAILMWVCASYLWSHEKQANQEKQQVEVSNKATAEKPPAHWESLPNDSRVLRLWDATGPQWPQLALLDLSKEMYQEMQKDQSTFINKYKIFPNKVQPAARYTELQTTPDKYTGRYIVFSLHRPSSGNLGASAPMEWGTEPSGKPVPSGGKP